MINILKNGRRSRGLNFIVDYIGSLYGSTGKKNFTDTPISDNVCSRLLIPTNNKTLRGKNNKIKRGTHAPNYLFCDEVTKDKVPFFNI